MGSASRGSVSRGSTSKRGSWADRPFGLYGIRSTSGRYTSYWNAFLLTFKLQQELEELVRRNVDNFLDRSDKNDLQKASRDQFCAAKESLSAVIHKRLSPDARAVFSRDDIKNEIVLYVASSKRSQGEVVKSLACVIL